MLDSIETKTPPEQLTGVIATRETAWDYAGFLGLLVDPDPVLQKMSEGPEILESLSADPHLMSQIQTRKAGTLDMEFEFQPGSDKGQEEDAASKKLCEAFSEDLHNINLRETISQILDAVLYGFTAVEIIWKHEGGMVRIAGLNSLPARWFGFNKDNEPRFISINSMIEGEPVPPLKMVFARHFPTYDNPFGIRLLSRCFWPVYFKRGGMKFWSKFAEKYAGMFLLGKYQNEGAAKDMLKQLTNMVQSAVAVVPYGSEVEVIQGNVAGSADVYERFCKAMDSEISKAILGQTLTTEAGDKGSYSLGQVHENVMKSYQQSDQALVKTFFDDLAWAYAQVNNSTAKSPVFSWIPPEDEKKTLAERDQILSNIGVSFSKEYFQNKYGFSPEDFELKPVQQTAPLPGKQSQEKTAQFSEPKFPDQEAIDAYMRSITPKIPYLAEKTMKPIMEAIQNCSSYEEVMTKIAEVYPNLNTDQMEETLHRAIFVSEIYGRLTAQEK